MVIWKVINNQLRLLLNLFPKAARKTKIEVKAEVYNGLILFK
jgi:hypothetical protein